MAVVLVASGGAAVAADLDVGSDVILMDSTLGDVTVTLPDPAGCQEHLFTFKRVSAESPANACMVVPSAGAGIDGDTGGFQVASPWSVRTVMAHGSDWYVLGGYL